MARDGLIHVDDSIPGISRRKYGRGYAYYDADGTHIADRAAQNEMVKRRRARFGRFLTLAPLTAAKNLISFDPVGTNIAAGDYRVSAECDVLNSPSSLQLGRQIARS